MSQLVKHAPSPTPDFLPLPEVRYPFLNYKTPDIYARIITQRMKQAAPPFVPINANRTAMTNLLLQSDNLAATWSLGAVTIGAAVANPNDGRLNAKPLIEDGSNAQHRITQPFTIAAGGTYTIAVAVLANGRTRGRVLFGDSAFASAVAALEYDLSAGTVVSTAVAGAPTMSNALLLAIPNSSWFYLLFTARLDGSTTAAAVGLGLHNGTSYTYTGDGASGAYFYRPTIALGSFTRMPLIDTVATTRSILAPAVHPDDPFAYIVGESEQASKSENGELTWTRIYSTIPKDQTTSPGSRHFTKPSYTATDPFNPFDAGATQVGVALRVTDFASLGNASYSAATGIYTDGDGKVYSPIKAPSSQAVCYATAGTFTLTYKSSTTAALAWNAGAAAITTALAGLADLSSDGITATCIVNALNNTSTGGGIDISLVGANSSTPAITLDATGLTVNLTKNAKTIITSPSYQQIKLPSNITVTGHSFNASLDLVVAYPSGGVVVVHPVGSWGIVDANTIWVPCWSNNTVTAQQAGNYASTYTVSGGSTYVGGVRLVRTKTVETFYLEGVSTGITSTDDIPTPTGLQNPNTFLTALLTPLTGFQAYDSDGPEPWESTIIHRLKNSYVKFEDLA